MSALDDAARVARRALPVRGRGHRRGRRVRPHGRAGPRRRCCTSARASPTGGRTCTTPAARARRWSTSSATTPATTSGFDAPLESDIDALAGAVSAGCAVRTARATSWAGRRRRDRRGVDPAGRDCHLDPAGRRACWDGGCPPRSAASARPVPWRTRRRRGRRSARSAASRWSCCSAARRAAGAGVCVPRAGSPRRRVPWCWWRPSRRGCERGVGRPAFDASATSPSRRDAQLAGVPGTCCSSSALRRWRSSPTRAGPASLRPTAAHVHSLGDRRRRHRGALEALAERVASGAAPARRSPRRGQRRQRRADGRRRADVVARCCRTRRSSSTRRSPRPGMTRRRPRPRRRTTG